MALEEYRRKRRFKETPEPVGKVERSRAGELKFAVQKHHATRLHYDFRLEMGGVLKSWAVPKGPTLDAAEKRLAMMVEDHPMDYMLFEGIIPAGNYGAGTVMLWDKGTYRVLNGDPEEVLVRGDLKFILDGEKLKGEFALVKMRSRRPGSKGNEWLLLKKKDAYVRAGWDAANFDFSALTNRSLAEIAADEGSSTWTSSKESASKAKIALPKRGSAADEMRQRKAQAARRTLEMTSKTGAAAPSRQGQPYPSAPSVDPSELRGAKKASVPESVKPMLATLVSDPPAGSDWLFEIKWDGVRALAFLRDGKVRLQSRSLRDITPHYPELAGIAADFRSRNAIVDGEIVALDEKGRSRFELLQQRMNTVPDRRLLEKYPVAYFVYDLIYLDGYDLRRVDLEDRKNALKQVLLPPGEGARVHYSDHQEGQGPALLEIARKNELEGIIAKRRKSCYYEQRSKEWLKIKIVKESIFAIGGYTEPRKSREHFGSLVLGEFNKDGKLVHTGNAGSGFSQASQKTAWAMLKPLVTDKNPFTSRPPTPQKPTWVKPRLYARVKYVEMTADGKMRAPVVLEVLDKLPESAAEEADLEAPSEGEFKVQSSKFKVEDTLFKGPSSTQTVNVDGRTLSVKNLDKVWFPEDKFTKRDIIEYYYRIAPTFLPYMRGRPVSMKRYPDGIHKPYFFQKEAGEHMPEWVQTENIGSEHGKSETINYVVCNDRATLVYLTNLGCIEQNLWFSRVGTLDNPDFVLFDLDPGDDTPFENVIRVAQVLHEKLDALEVTACPKTSGASGLHVYVPLVTEYSYNHSRAFAQLVCTLVAVEVPELVTQVVSLKRRPQDRVYLDFLQNTQGKTIPPPYSVRARPGATISTPLQWSEVNPRLDPTAFNIQTIWRRLDKHGDLFSGTLEKPQRIEDALERLQALLATR